jgi:hypothetical protein
MRRARKIDDFSIVGNVRFGRDWSAQMNLGWRSVRLDGQRLINHLSSFR